MSSSDTWYPIRNLNAVKSVDKCINTSDNSINNVVKAAEEKVAMNNAENGKNIELANNIVKEGKKDVQK